MILTSAIHSQPFAFFILACTRLTLKKLLAIYYIQVYHRIPTTVFCISYTGLRKKHGNSYIKPAHCPTVHCKVLISNVQDFRDHLHAGTFIISSEWDDLRYNIYVSTNSHTHSL